VAIANDFLRFARIEDLDLRPTDLGKVLEEMVDFFTPTAKAAKIEIKAFISADLPPVLLDRDLFKQALLNLMLNAEQAMLQGGELTMLADSGGRGAAERGARSAEREKKPRMGASPSALRASHVCLSLIDTGQGISPEVAAKIFQPFFTTKADGSGLGLPTTKKIIEAHRGAIAVESEVGHGTKFTIRLRAPFR